jgi:hypothetical protein
MERYVPSGFRDGRCGVCERLEVHGVCWLEERQVSDGGLYRHMVGLQPIVEVGEVGEQYLASIPLGQSAISEYCYSLSATTLT